MVFFPLYAVFVWYFCYRWRRNWLGWTCLAFGLFGVGVLFWLDRFLDAVLMGSDR